MAASTSPHVNSAAAYDGAPGCWLDDTITPNRVQASTSMCGYTLRWLINLRLGKCSSSDARIFLFPNQDENFGVMKPFSKRVVRLNVIIPDCDIVSCELGEARQGS